MAKNKNIRHIRRGFTLVEMMLVIAIIAVMAGVVFVAVSTSRNKATLGRAKAEMKQIENYIQTAQIYTGLPLRQITLSNSSESPCISPVHDVRNVPSTDPCYVSWKNALIRIEAAAGVPAGTLSNIYDRDPWGAPYGLNENEGELGCNKDTFRTFGPDGQAGGGDDYSIDIPFTRCQG